MNRSWLVVIPLALAGVLGCFLFRADGDAPLTGEPGPVPDAFATEAATASAPAAPAEHAEIERTPAADPPSSERSTPPAPALIRGRCLASETSEPLAGCTVQLRGFVAREQPGAQQAREAWKNPGKITTGADGRFAFSIEPHAALSFLLEQKAERRLVTQHQWSELKQGQVVDLGDVVLRLGSQVAGRVVDKDGAPVGKARIHIRNDALVQDSTAGPQVKDFTYLTSRGDGSLVGSEALAAGTWKIRVEGDHELIRPESFVVAEGAGTTELEVVVTRPEEKPTLSGVVVDESGSPVAGVRLIAGSEFQSRLSGRNAAWSNKDGTFLIRRGEGDDRPVPITVDTSMLGATHEQVGAADLTHAWGTKDIRIVVRRPKPVELLVVEAGSGKPVTNYGVRLFPRAGTVVLTTQPQYRGEHEGGRVILKDVPRGKHTIQVHPADTELLPSEPVEFEVSDQGASLRIEVHRRSQVEVRVVFADGSPVAGTRVQLIRREGPGELELDTISGTHADVNKKFFTSGVVAIVLDSGVTDADGRVGLRGPASRGGLAVKALGPGHVPVLEKGVSAGPGVPAVTIRVSKGATLRGLIEPLSVLQGLGPSEKMRTSAERLGAARDQHLAQFTPALVLQEVGGLNRRIPGSHAPRFAIAADGTFRMEGIPAGDWDVMLSHFESSDAGGGWTGHLATTKLQTVARLADGEEREVRLDASALVPALLIGTVVLDGEPYANRRGSVSGKGFQTDAAGRFEVKLRAGTHQVALLPDAKEGNVGKAITGNDSVELAPGATAERVFHMLRRRMRIRVLEEDGTPATQRLLSVVAPNYYASREERTDASGWLVLDPAPSGPVTIHTWPKLMDQQAVWKKVQSDPTGVEALRVKLGPFELAADQKAGEFEARIPAN